MKLFSSLLLVHGALASNLYGRTISRDQRDTMVKRNVESEAFDEIRGFMEFARYLEISMSISMSMSMSDSTDQGSGNISTPSPSTKSPTSPTPTPLTVAPTSTPSLSTVTTSPSPPTGSSFPSLTQAPSSNAVELSLFECSDLGLALPALTPAPVTTAVSLDVLYEAESTANATDAFLSDLESALFSIALIAALDCDGTQRRELQQVTMRRHLTVSTEEVGYCTVTESVDNSCFTLEMNTVFAINDDVDSDYAAFLAYAALQSAMMNYQGDEIDTVKRLTYLAPTPMEPATPTSRSSKPSFSLLAIGACAAMVGGGTLALFVWVRNRSTRNKQHVELLEDGSLCSPAERT